MTHGHMAKEVFSKEAKQGYLLATSSSSGGISSTRSGNGIAKHEQKNDKYIGGLEYSASKLGLSGLSNTRQVIIYVDQSAEIDQACRYILTCNMTGLRTVRLYPWNRAGKPLALAD